MFANVKIRKQKFEDLTLKIVPPNACVENY